jgi:hypothetical protein
MDVAPGSAADERGSHPGLAGGQHVVVDAVADVEDLRRGPPRVSDQSIEEVARRLGHAPHRRGCDEICLETGVPEKRFDASGLVPGDPYRESRTARRGDAVKRVLIEIGCLDRCRRLRTIHSKDVPQLRMRFSTLNEGS